MSQRREIESAVKHILGKTDKNVIAIVERGISRGYDRKKLRDRLSDEIDERALVSKLCDRVFDDILANKSSSKSGDGSSKSGGGGSGSSSRKRPKFEEFPSSRPNADGGTASETNGHGKVENGRASDHRDDEKDGPSRASKSQKVDDTSQKNSTKPDEEVISTAMPESTSAHASEKVENGNAATSGTVISDGTDEPSSSSSKPEIDLADKLKIKQVMAHAQKMIEERKKKLNITTPSVPVAPAAVAPASTKLAPGEAQQYMELAMQKAVRAAELKAAIAGRLPGALKEKMDTILKGTTATISTSSPTVTTSTASVSSSLGIQPVHSIKANIRHEKAHQFRTAQHQVRESQTPAAVQAETQSTHYDAEMVTRAAQRQRRGFKFHERGEFESLANKQRAKAKLDKLQAEISSISKRTGISAAVKLAMAAPKSAAETEQGDVPQMEWWDAVLFTDEYDLTDVSADAINQAIDDDAAQLISALVEHPIQLRPPDEPISTQYLKVFLTKKEQRKLRRQNRKEVQRERSEKIRLGLEAPPEPKMKISNLMRVLGTEAIKDPTKMEAHVRKQMAERQRKHDEANKERKLTKEQVTAKKNKKLSEDVSLGVHVSVYRLFDLSNQAKRFKVEQNAKQLKMTGVVVLHKDVNVIVVEGGPKQQKFYRRLMMQRLKWDDDYTKATINDDEPKSNKCTLVWEGVVRKRAFGELKFRPCTLEKQARELMEKYGVPEYWDMAYTGTVVVQEDDDHQD